MYEEKIPLHKIETVPIDAQAGDEWELVCYECTFRARYSQDMNQEEHRLEILDIGDPQARHTGTHGSATAQLGYDHWSPSRHHDEEETWLTPELRQKLSEILQGLE